MHKLLQLSYESIVNELSLPEITGFKIGVTQSVADRKESYISQGYSELYELANGDNNIILQAESDLIDALSSDVRIACKCLNKTSGYGIGQTTNADKLYVAVRIKHPEDMKIVDQYLADFLFSTGFPITLT